MKNKITNKCFIGPVRTAKYVSETSVIDPDTGNIIDVCIYKHENEGMFCIDSSFIEHVAEPDKDDETICYIGDPFNIGGKLMLIENDTNIE